MDEQTRRGLIMAADAHQRAAGLRELVITAGRQGATPTEICKLIFPAYSYDYIAKLIRDDRAEQRTGASEAA